MPPWGGREGAVAAAAKSRQSCPTLCDPIGGSPYGLPHPALRPPEFISAPCSISSRTISLCPAREAIIKGVIRKYPHWAFTFAPLFIRILATSLCPSREATIRGDRSLPLALTVAPA